MKVKTFLKCMMLAGFIPFASITVANDDTPKKEKVIALTNDNDGGVDEQTLKVPVTAIVNRQVLNVQFTGNVPMATVSVNNAFTGATVSQKSMTALSGSFCTMPVGNLPQGSYTVSVTNEQNGESVSGEFDVE